MRDQVEEKLMNGDVDISIAEVTFDNLTILKELGIIVNVVRNEDFLEIVPKGKIGRVKWVPLFDYLKQKILDEMTQELNSMWVFENMPEKLSSLEKQIEKFAGTSTDRPVWRPQLGNVKAQLKANDVAHLLKQKKSLEILAKEYETRMSKVKKTIMARRGYLKALQLDIQNYQKKNEDLYLDLCATMENHSNLAKSIGDASPINTERSWSEDVE